MTRGEFIATCVSSGYATKPAAEGYAEGKVEFSINDLIEVYRKEQRRIDIAHGAREERFRTLPSGAKTTKRYYWGEDWD